MDLAVDRVDPEADALARVVDHEVNELDVLITAALFVWRMLSPVGEIGGQARMRPGLRITRCSGGVDVAISRSQIQT